MPSNEIPQLIKSYSAKKLDIAGLDQISEEQWLEEGATEVMRLARAMISQVPAYKDVAKKAGMSEDSISVPADIARLPVVDKQSYLRAYPLEKLCWNGKFSQENWTIYATSGSTGEPFYFPHTSVQDQQYALYAECYLRTNFDIHRRTTLYINAFPIGIWIGGIFTLKAISMVAERGYALSIINPGIHKEEILKAIKRFGGDFDQIIIGSYGPFLKDVLDDGERAGIDWKRLNVGFVFAAEGFSETFRDHILSYTSAKNHLTGTVNQYGTVDLGTMAFETPLSILIRRIAVSNPKVYDALFDDKIKLPTFAQYMPQLFYFEELNKNLICSAWGGIPIVRYNLKDRGGVYTFSQVKDALASNGIDIFAEGKKHNIPVWQMPFVYVYERSDFSISFFAFQIHPATIRRALETATLREAVTGKFTMMTEHDKHQNPYIRIHVELHKEIKPSLKLRASIVQAITEQLLNESSEFRETWKHKGARIKPRITCWPYEHATYFKTGTKQKWVRK